jgi:hypothetical protein
MTTLLAFLSKLVPCFNIWSLSRPLIFLGRKYFYKATFESCGLEFGHLATVGCILLTPEDSCILAACLVGGGRGHVRPCVRPKKSHRTGFGWGGGGYEDVKNISFLVMYDRETATLIGKLL